MVKQGSTPRTIKSYLEVPAAPALEVEGAQLSIGSDDVTQGGGVAGSELPGLAVDTGQLTSSTLEIGAAGLLHVSVDFSEFFTYYISWST